MKKRKGFFFPVLSIPLILAGCGSTPTPETTVSVTGVSLNKSKLVLKLNAEYQLVASIAPSNATNSTVTWTSSNEEAVYVTKSGLAKGLSVGSSVVTVTTVDGGYTATCNVTVQEDSIPVTGVSVTQSSMSLEVGDKVYLEANIEPDYASNQNLTYSSSNEECASIDSNGLITSLAVGSSTMTVTTVDGGFTATCEVTVSEKESGGSEYVPTESDDILFITTTEVSTEPITVSVTENYKQIYVNAPDNDVEIELNGVTIENSENSPIFVETCNSIEISAKKNTVNYIKDTRPTYTEDDDAQGKGAIMVYDGDLTLKGKGELNISANYYNGVHGKDDVDIKNLTLNVSSVNHAIRASDNLNIESGTITIVSGGDGLKTTGSGLSSKGKQKGYINISGGKISINSWTDAISAGYNVVTTNEPEITIATNKYSTYSGEVIEPDTTNCYLKVPSTVQSETQTDYTYAAYVNEEFIELAYVKFKSSDMGGGPMFAPGGGGGWGPGGGGSSSGSYHVYKFEKPVSATSFVLYRFAGANNTNFSTTSYNAKSSTVSFNSSKDMIAINSISGSTISMGSWSIYSTSNTNKADVSAKGIKGYNEVHIEGGTISINAFDDGISTPASTTLDNGLSATGYVYIAGGEVSISSADDGVHARTNLYIEGGSLSVTKAYEGIEASYIYVSGGEAHVFASDDGVNAGKDLTVTGGLLDVAVSPSGDTDGIDSNGTIHIQGGAVIVRGPNSTNMAAVDTDDGVTITGGTLITFGKIAETPSKTSNITLTSKSGTYSSGKTYNVSFTGGTVYSCAMGNYSYTNCTVYSSLGTTTVAQA